MPLDVVRNNWLSKIIQTQTITYKEKKKAIHSVVLNGSNTPTRTVLENTNGLPAIMSGLLCDHK